MGALRHPSGRRQRRETVWHARRGRPLALWASLTVSSALGCNALLGIEDASLTCVGATCDAGADPRGDGSAQASGNGGRSSAARGGSGSLSVGVALDAGLDASSPLGAVNGSEAPANVILPAPPGANTGSANDDNSGSDSDENDETNGSDQGSGGSGNSGPSDPDPMASGGSDGSPMEPSLCAGRAVGEAFCNQAARVSCGPGGSVERSLSCSSEQHCQQGTGPSCAACLTGDARCDGEVLSICNATRSGFDSQRCDSAPLCNAPQLRCEPAKCQPNESRCRGRNLERCNAVGTALEPAAVCSSPQSCNEREGRCDVCEPGTRRCLDSTTIGACDAFGAAETSIACGLLESCSAGACVVLRGGLPLL